MPAPVRPSTIPMELPPSLTQRMDLSDFNFLKVLGKGSFGKVCMLFTGRIQSFTGHYSVCVCVCVCVCVRAPQSRVRLPIFIQVWRCDGAPLHVSCVCVCVYVQSDLNHGMLVYEGVGDNGSVLLPTRRDRKLMVVLIFPVWE